MDPIKFSKQKDAIIDQMIEKLRTDTTDLQEKLFIRMIEDLLEQLDTSGGKILSDSGQLLFSNKQIDEIVAIFNQEVHAPFALDFANDVQGLTVMNAEQYREMLGRSSRLTNAINKASDLTREMLGLNTAGNIRPGGYLEGLVESREIVDKLKQTVSRSILAGEDVKSLRKTLETEILGSENSGLFEKHYRTFAYDTVAATDRSYNKVIADEVGLDFAIYSPGTVKDSRPFCVARAGKVFTREEVESWNNLGNWQGRIPGQPVEIVAGGYNCMHSINWISKELAVQLRPDLAEE